MAGLGAQARRLIFLSTFCIIIATQLAMKVWQVRQLTVFKCSKSNSESGSESDDDEQPVKKKLVSVVKKHPE